MTVYYSYEQAVIPGVIKIQRGRYRQKPITNTPLPYSLTKYLNLGNMPDLGYPAGYGLDYPDSHYYDANDSCYKRLVDSCGASAASAMAANVATWKQTQGSILGRVNQLLRFTSLLKKGNLVAAARTLGLGEPRKSVAKSVANQWLEYSYGWKPLVNDIYTSVNVLQGECPIQPHKCRGRAKTGQYVRKTYYDPYGHYYEEYREDYKIEMGSLVRVVNPNLYLANSLGLINPLSVAWELVPFSFVVDWFVPVGSFLQSMTDWIGMKRINTYTTKYSVSTLQRYATDPKWMSVAGKKRMVRMTRGTAIPNSPSLRPHFTGFYSARGANAIALLVGSLKRL